jgi:hypothetical protein
MTRNKADNFFFKSMLLPQVDRYTETSQYSQPQTSLPK